MKKRLLLTLATVVMLGVSVGATVQNLDDPVPTCNPLTNPQCKPSSGN